MSFIFVPAAATAVWGSTGAPLLFPISSEWTDRGDKTVKTRSDGATVLHSEVSAALSEWVNSQLTWSSHLLIRASWAPPAGCLSVTSSWGEGGKKKPGTGWIDCVSDTAWRRSVVLQEDMENVAGKWIIPNCCHRVLIPDQCNQGSRRKISDSECAVRSLSTDFGQVCRLVCWARILFYFFSSSAAVVLSCVYYFALKICCCTWTTIVSWIFVKKCFDGWLHSLTTITSIQLSLHQCPLLPSHHRELFIIIDKKK